jgi:hypothetical protein
VKPSGYFLQVAQQVDHLRLHAHVERRGRLVQHDEFRLQHHGAGDGDALALAAGEFVRIAVRVSGIEPTSASAATTRCVALVRVSSTARGPPAPRR